MPTSFNDQFFTFDPANPPAVGTPVDYSKFTLTDQNDDGDIDQFDNDAVAGLDVTATWPGDTVTIDVPGVGNVTYSGTTVYISDGSVIFTPTDGQILQAGDFVSSTFVTVEGPLLTNQLGPPCFTPGTEILTQHGPRAIELLRPGDTVLSYDRGPIELLHVRERKIGLDELRKNPRKAPVVIPGSAFGDPSTRADLLVSPQHRILIRSKTCLRMFGHNEILAPAAQLIGFAGIHRSKPVDTVKYMHLLFDHHAIVFANGSLTESLFLGPNARLDFGRIELASMFAVEDSSFSWMMKPARQFIAGRPLKTLLRRHAKNNKLLIDGANHSAKALTIPLLQTELS